MAHTDDQFFIKRNDLLPAWDAVLRDENGTPVDLSAATAVRMKMSSTVGGTPVVDGLAAIIDAPNGLVRYTWVLGDTAVAGRYVAEFEATFPTGPYTFPNDGYGLVTITADVGGTALGGVGGLTCSPWATLADLSGPCADHIDDLVLMADALQIASDVLFDLTRRRWPGACEDTVRPCGKPCGRWPAVGPCGCSTSLEVLLPRSPVSSIVEVLVAGAVVPAAEYVLMDGRFLKAVRRADGTSRRWPTCQDMSRPSSEAHTFSVEYEWGAAPPLGGRAAAAILACELARSFSGDAACRLPERVTSITRQGVSLAILDPLTLFSEGRTGLRDVDLWLESVRYGDKHRGSALIDPLRVPSVRRGH